ncbi:MAG: pilus assembly protein [Polaromonas sp.]|nr:pilus assembly protein [Polaromonas sp.]
MRNASFARPTQRLQRGVYAVEFAIVFLLFFAMLYAVLAYGVLFAVRLGMQDAAETAARVGLRAQQTWNARLVAAETEAVRRLWWMRSPPQYQTQLCVVGPSLATPACDPAPGSLPTCSLAADTTCQIVVTIRYAPYAQGTPAWLPPLPSALLPGSGGPDNEAFTLVARASMLLDERSLR